MDPHVTRWLYDPVVGKLVVVMLGMIAVFTLRRLLQKSVNHYISNNTARYRARKLVSFVAYGLAAVVLITVFSDKLGGLTVAFGVAGAGIAFALQEVIASVAGWIAVEFGNFYSTGDRVELGGIRGDVIDIGVLRTTLMEVGEWVKADLYSGRIVRVANSFVFKSPVFNYSADFPFVWDEITLPVRYGSDWKLARRMLDEVAREVCGDFAQQSREAWAGAISRYRLEDAEVDPMVTMVANDNWLEFTLRYIVDYRHRRSTRNALFTRILEEVDASGNRVRLASATFEVVNLPAFDVRLGEQTVAVESRYVP